jgi:hypothetical protein
MTAERVRSMTGPGNLTGLDILGISGGADDDAVRALGEADLPRLTTLCIHELWNRDDPLLTPAAFRALVESPLFARLTRLSVWGEWIDDDGLLVLFGSPRAAGLRDLYVWPRRDSRAWLRALLESPHLVGLTRLNLSRIVLDPETVARLARPEVLPGLSELVVDEATTDDHKAALARRFGDRLFVGAIEDYIGE